MGTPQLRCRLMHQSLRPDTMLYCRKLILKAKSESG